MLKNSRYLSGEKKNLESMTDAVKPVDHNLLGYLKDLRVELQKIYDQGVRFLGFVCQAMSRFLAFCFTRAQMVI
jgi:hypothetical protein